ncbi:MAG: esterase, partial [Chitinophagaceae bacterium]|nr:esterase [Chitinophagaceae bacterium]
MDTSIEVNVDAITFHSDALDRDLRIDFYLPQNHAPLSLLLINDGQDLVAMEFERILNKLYQEQSIHPLLCVGIHCGDDRRNEYGMIGSPDYKGRGAKAGLYQQFVREELLPLIFDKFRHYEFIEHAYAGFSLGGLS